MKILIEQYGYNKDRLSKLLDSHYYTELQNNVAQIPYVGYFLSHKIPDTVFILPKVFMIEGKAFGKYVPEEIVDFENLAEEDRKAVFALSVWIYRAIKLYSQRKGKLLETTEVMQNVVSHYGSSSETMIDIILSLFKFHKDHRNLFTYITRIRHSGQNKIHWQKTISKTQALVQRGRPFYIRPQTKQKEINYDEELIVLFFSVLNYLNLEFRFDIRSIFGYDLLKPSQVKSMIESGKGMRVLRQNRRKYFTDEMVLLWNLLFTFFKQSENVQSKTNSDEQAMLVRDFNLVFEDMIDTLIGESKLPKGLKEQKDGKIIDHIYREHSLIEANEDVYFIGDSKYYKEENAIGKNSLYKQFTYARNVIQYNMDIYNNVVSGVDEYGLEYMDKETEGYNITPNFFIRGFIEKGELNNYSDNKLRIEGKEEISYHFENRLFDRDTLILQSYNINFLFVLSAYVQGAGEHTQEVRKLFREEIQKMLESRFDFYAMTAHPGVDARQYIQEHFQDVLGKMYKPYPNPNYFSLALDSQDKYAAENQKLLQELRKHFFVEEMAIGADPETRLEAVKKAAKAQGFIDDDVANSKVLVVVDIQNSNWDNFDNIEAIYIGMETAEKSFEYYHEFADADYILLTHRDDRTFLFKTHGKPKMQNEKPQNALGRPFKKPSAGEQLMWPSILHMVFTVTKEDLVEDYKFSLKRINKTATLTIDGKQDFYSPRVVKLADIVYKPEEEDRL